MAFEKYVEVLSRAELFRGFDKDEVVSMLKCLEPKIKEYGKGNYLAVAGEEFQGIGIMLEGEAAAYKENIAGTRVIMVLLKPGDVFGEIVAFSSQSQWPVTVEAQQPCKALFISRQKIVGECRHLCPWHRKLIENMLMMVSERALTLSRKVEYLSIKSIRGKISTYLLEQYKKTGETTFILPMNRNELADFLNVSRPSLSREMCSMRDEGIIDFHRASVRIKDLQALKRMAQ
ncbi:Crp/Fnr family transcriptional regulator [Caldicoprobacter faecalis]|uniref:cAMP-binding domain of CRP or a regulatory subunit of cAMP-dependent protein kinases n=1 Tax=Caldicoprobacter faecalis TaxID=937334 RepID=A0A1I5TEW9_9FIRM|nr:Crp/Fnr family transcriptional regulator [Caldicoprobacter faecalis]SFP81583.1 cAMP-binding domain of CRP or a regulatory subunit of cAMP-dependent protein kinases [Caldicoprobacter faecalis]